MLNVSLHLSIDINPIFSVSSGDDDESSFLMANGLPECSAVDSCRTCAGCKASVGPVR